MRAAKWTHDLAAALTLAALNVWICWRLFWVEYTSAFSSVEGFFVGIARYISQHWSDRSWWPIWHCGMPYQDTYVPLLHLVTAAVTSLAHVSAARAYHGVVGATYSLGAVTLYLMAVRLGAHRGAAFLGALTYSLFSPSAVLIPEFGRDVGGPLFSRRLQVLTVYGEGPHISAMALLPLAILALQHAVEKRTGRAFALAALAIALVFLTNVPGTMALALAVFCWLASQPAKQRAPAWKIAAGASLLAYGIACFGVPPSSLGTVFGNVGPMHSGFSNSLKHAPYLLPGLLALVAAAGYLLCRVRLPLWARFAALYMVLTLVLVWTARASQTFELLPQVGRLHLEMEMGVCLLLGGIAWAIYSLIPRWIRPVVLVLFLAPVGIQIGHYHERARSDIQPVDVRKRSEYTTAVWLERNLPGQRVYAMGSTSFWLNAFTGTPQMIGCCEQGEAMPVLSNVAYQVNAGTTPEQTAIAKTWMQAMGVQAMVVNGPDSTDEYKDIKTPERFEAVLPALHREHGDTIYRIPQRSTSLAHVVRPGEEVRQLPAHLVDPADVARYAAVIQDPSRPAAEFEWLDGNRARIRARLAPADLVSVQVAHFNGWKAAIHGTRQPISADGLGFILIRPECQGDCEIELRWTGAWDWWIALAISLVSLAAAGILLRRSAISRTV
jgi:hypothetical protein